jgi:antitoxin (DNA-binding transcriptional repressor) of toxin-antitoxin stability system
VKTATVTETKDRLSALLEEVQGGETILILDRGRPIARLEPALGSEAGDSTGRIARLEREGLIRCGTGGLAPQILEQPAVRAVPGASIVQALIDEREEGR